MPSNHKFKLDDVVFDNQAKERVLITNGIERTVAGTVVESEHTEFEPTEGIAIRSWRNVMRGYVCIAWTYRKIDAAHLEPDGMRKVTFMAGTTGRDTKYLKFIGRI